MPEVYYFRCRTNPSAPPLILYTEWEANEMRTNLDYDRVDEDGLPVVVEEEVQSKSEQSIPFDMERRK